MGRDQCPVAELLLIPPVPRFSISPDCPMVPSETGLLVLLENGLADKSTSHMCLAFV